MKITLTPRKKTNVMSVKTMRLPPAGFILSDARFTDNDDEDDYRKQIASSIRALYPELTHWRDAALVEALGEFGENVHWNADFSIQEVRDDKFIAYLYACQIMPVYQWLHFDPTDMGEAWDCFDAGKQKEHAINLYKRVPILEFIFKTQERFLLEAHTTTAGSRFS